MMSDRVKRLGAEYANNYEMYYWKQNKEVKLMEKRGQLLDAVAQELIVCIRFTHEILARIEHDTYIHMYAKYIFESRRSKLEYASEETKKYLIDLKKYPVLSGTARNDSL